MNGVRDNRVPGNHRSTNSSTFIRGSVARNEEGDRPIMADKTLVNPCVRARKRAVRMQQREAPRKTAFIKNVAASGNEKNGFHVK